MRKSDCLDKVNGVAFEKLMKTLKEERKNPSKTRKPQLIGV